MKRKILSALSSAGILALIAGVTTALLAVTNLLTADVIRLRSEREENEARRQVLTADTFEETSVEEENVVCYRGIKDGAPVGYVFTVTTSGKSAGLVVMTGVDTEGRITGVVVTENNETAGYVDKVTDGGLLSAFTGKTNTDGVDAVSQATRTSNGVLKGVDSALRAYQTLAGGKTDE